MGLRTEKLDLPRTTTVQVTRPMTTKDLAYRSVGMSNSMRSRKRMRSRTRMRSRGVILVRILLFPLASPTKR